MRTAPAAFQWTVFPVVMAGAVVWSLYWMASGTAAPETILVPLSGGGLIAGIAMAAKAVKSSVRIVGGQSV